MLPRGRRGRSDTGRALSAGQGEWRDRVALRSVDDQIKSLLSALGFTPVDRTRMGVAEVRSMSKLEALQARAAQR